MADTNRTNNVIPLNVKSLLVGLGWDEAQRSLINRLCGIIGVGSSKEPEDLNLDLSLIVFDDEDNLYASDPMRSMIYHDNLRMFGAIRHHGDNRTGQGDGCDEYIIIRFDLLPEDVGKLIAVVNITDHVRRHQDFSMTGDAYATVVNFDNMTEISTLTLNKSSNKGMAGVFAFEIKKIDKKWHLRVLDEPIERANSAVAMFQHYSDDEVNRSILSALDATRNFK